MKIRRFITDFIITFVVTLIVTAGLTYIWEGAFNWETAFRFAIIFGIVFPSVNALRNK
ncbi:hypothetical protein NLC26_00265 [Candidatus Aminicenantes bacterium AC-708-M15]|nr:hypothetical protein [SCandidatus Aminicenantes bacterium Aminicenantia_JdfR_composite]MCP2596500.1 hypothetical protein [Candidatus Aminicenantes bacterium AC-335-G13]MCP2603895.1 hypothetical protein [Candidatus Aminicenantes bacterium AC-708-M15]MCP2618094.1 hypothetical protein [Candidatus Aminicenantes bacterium AC-335-A11]